MANPTNFHFKHISPLSDSEDSCSSDNSDLQDVSTYRLTFERFTLRRATINGNFRQNNMGDKLIFSSPNLSEDLRLITEIPDMCDVMFLVGTGREPVYGVKAILATRSRCFYNMILSAQHLLFEEKLLRKKKNLSTKIKQLIKPQKVNKSYKGGKHLVIPVVNFTWDIFQRVNWYLHTGKINIDLNSVIGVLAAAKQFNLEELRAVCDRFFCAVLSTATALPLLVAAESYAENEAIVKVKTQILKLIGQNAREVLSQDDFEFVPKYAAISVLTYNCLEAEEDLKWQAALRWSRRHCRGQELDVLRKTVKQFINCINLNCLSVRKLALEVRPLRIVPDNIISTAISHQRHCSDLTGLHSSLNDESKITELSESQSRCLFGSDSVHMSTSDYNDVLDIKSLHIIDLTDPSLVGGTNGLDITHECNHGNQSFFNENDFLDELLEDDSELSRIFDVSMASDA